MDYAARELTQLEKQAIKKLVVNECANYCSHYGCLQLDDACFMLQKCWTGAYCKHFRTAVLPLDAGLEVSLTVNNTAKTRTCKICGEKFLVDGKKVYCSDACSNDALRKQKREYIRKKRVGCRNLPIQKPHSY